ncbi:MAG: hypothetical protein AUK35_09395 [Zetaproteobacteria bacterium CG2_30_46_52]|nr:MAG: hypothetical protein AUK35_09395 [Zetaproteobacteria bacterium CG2_30_46_52]
MVRWLLLALLSLFFAACSDVTEQQGAAMQQGLTNVTIQFGHANQSRDLQGAGIIPDNVSSISVQAFDKSGAKTFGPFVANKPNFDITIQVTNGDNVRFEVVAFAENNAAGTRLYQGSKTINLTGKSVVVPVVMSLVIDVSSNAAQVAAGASVVLSSTVGGVSSTAASPVIWSATVGSISGNVWIAPNQIGIQTLTARIDPIVNPDQDATIVASIDINVVDQTLPVIVLNGASTVTLEAGAVYTDANATVTDNIDATNVSLVGISTINTNQPGAYSVTYNYTDTSGNVAATVVRTVHVQDTTAPVFTLTNLTDIYVEAVGVITPYAFVTPVVTDTYGIASVVVSNTGPFSMGTTTVTWTATDFTGLTSTKNQNIIVQDTTAPFITLAGSDSYTVELGQSYVDAGASFSDLIDGSGAVLAVGSVNTSVPGTYNLTYNYTDGSGNAAAQVTRSVNVQDSIPPAFTLANLTDIYVEAAGVTTPYAFTTPVVTDTYGVAGVVVSNSGPFSIGATLVTWTATDLAGLTATNNQNVIVQDTTVPELTLTGSADVYVEAGATYAELGATFVDAVDGTGSAIVAGAIVNTAVPSTYVVTYDYMDVAGNSAVQLTRNVIVQDTTVPVITLSGSIDVYVEAGTTYTELGATFTDVADGTGAAIVAGSVNAAIPATYVITYDYTDGAGNSAVQLTRNVIVQDTIVPVITLSGSVDVYVEAGATYTELGATFADVVDGTGSASVAGAVNTAIPSTYIVTYDYTDAAGNVAGQVTRNVIVQDTTAPVVTLTGSSDVYVEAGGTYTEQGATFADIVDGSGVAVAAGTVNTAIPSTYVITYDYTDGAGNAAVQVTRNVVVRDTTLPVITLNGSADVYVEVGGTYTELGATFADAVDGSGSAIVAGASVNTSILSTYVVTYDYIDAAGNAAIQAARNVIVQDTIAPAFTLANLADIYVEASGVTTPHLFVTPAVTDTYGVASVLVSNTGPFAIGTTTVTWTATDFAGLATTKNQNVIVQDTVSPLLVVSPNITLTATQNGGVPSSNSAIQAFLNIDTYATDLVSGSLTVSNDAPSILFPFGVTTVNFSVVDDYANSTVNAATVTVNHAQPSITFPTTNPYTIVVTEDVSSTFTMSVSDVDGDTYSFSLSSSATSGSASVDTYGLVTYQGFLNYAGADSFSVQVSDGYSAPVTQIVNLTVSPVNDAPSVQVNLPIDAYENAAAITIASADLYAADVDNTAAELIFTVTSIPAAGQLRLSSVPLVLSSTFTQADINAGLLTYLPPVTGTFGAGVGSFGFSVTDGASLAISGTFVINVIHVNTSPLFTAPIDHTATPGVGASITASQQIPFDVYVQAYDPDVLDTLTFSVYSYAGLNGVLTGPVSINTYAAVFSYTANAGTTTDNFQLLVVDGVANDLLDVSVSAIAVNSPPIINSPTNPYSFSTLVDTYANFAATASDPNGDTFSWDIYTAATNGLATVDAYGNVSYIGNTHYVGNDSFDVRVVDPYGAVSILNVNVSILGNANIVSGGVLDSYSSTLGSLWQYGVPISGPNATSGITADPYVWATNLAGNYNQNAAEYLYLPVLDLTAATNPTLSMRLWSTTSYTNYHGTNVEVLVGSVWTVIDPYITPYDGGQLNDVNLPAWEELGWTSTEQVYQLAAFDLTAYAGQQVQVRLAFRSEGSSIQSLGMYVDDIRIDEETSDLDSDGINGVLSEWNSTGTDPFIADTDGDGTADGADTLPLNPAAGFAGSITLSSTAGSLDVYAATDGTLWQYGIPTSGPSATSGITTDPYVWATNLAGNYPKNAHEYLYLPMLDLTSATNPTLSMRLWSTTSYTNYHGTNVEVLVGNIWTVIDPYITPYDGNQLNDVNLPAWEELQGYQLAVFNLSPYNGQQIQTRLAFRSEGSSIQSSGMYADDIRIDEGPTMIAGVDAAISTVNGNCNTTWDIYGSPYWVQSSVSIANGCRLQIDAGVVVKFDPATSVTVNNAASFDVYGAVGSPVYLTSINDDSIIGDSNHNGATVGAAGDWNQIKFAGGSSGSLLNTEVRYAGRSLIRAVLLTTLGTSGSTPTFANLTIRDSLMGGIEYDAATDGATVGGTVTGLQIINPGGHGIIVSASNASTGNFATPNINGSLISGVSGTFSGVSLSGVGAQPIISNMTISGGQHSLFASNGASGTFSGNTFDGATTSAVNLSGSTFGPANPSLAGSTITNAPVAVSVSNQTIPVGFAAPNMGANVDPYSVAISITSLYEPYTTLIANPLGVGSQWVQTNNISIPSGVQMDIYAGAVIKRQAGVLSVNSGGILNILGSNGNPVVFTSINDDAYGGAAAGSTGSPLRGEGMWPTYAAGSSGQIQWLVDRYSSQWNIRDSIPMSDVTIYDSNLGWSFISGTASPLTQTINNLQIDHWGVGGGQGLTIDGSTGTNALVFTGSNRMTKYTATHEAIQVTGAGANPTFQGFVVDSYLQPAILVTTGAGGTYSNNILRNSSSGISLGGTLLSWAAGATTISNNIFVNNAVGVHVINAPNGATIENNLIRGSLNQAVLVDMISGLTPSNVLVQNNLIVENTSGNILATGGAVHVKSDIANLTGPTVQLYSNTIADNISLGVTVPAGLVVDAYATVTATDNFIVFNTDSNAGHFNAFIDPNAVLSESYNATSDNTLVGLGAQFSPPAASPFDANWYLLNNAVGINNGSMLASAAPFIVSHPYAEVGVMDGAGADMLDMGFHHAVVAPVVADIYSSPTQFTLISGPSGSTEISVIPRDGGNAILGAGLKVVASFQVTPSGTSTIGTVKDHGDGTYSLIFTHGTLTGSDTVAISVNGTQLTPTLTVSW